MYQPLTPQQFQAARNAGFSTDQIIANEKIRQQQENGISAPAPQFQSNNPLYKTANFLGISKAGQGLATAARVFTGAANQTGNQEGQAFRDLESNLAKYPVGSPERRAFVQNYANTYKGGINTQAQIDPGTQLSNKQVLGSFGNVGLNILSAGELPTEGASSFGLSKGTSVADALAKETPLAKLGRLAAPVSKAAEGAAFGYGLDVANNATNNQSNVSKPSIGTAVGGLLPFATALTGALGKRVLGLTTGAGKDVIQRALDNPEAISTAISKSTPETKQALVDTAKQALNSFLRERNSQYGEALSKIVAKEPINKQAVIDSFAKSVDNFGGQIKNGALTFGDTALSSSEQKSLQDTYEIIKSWKNVTPQGMDTLRQRIGNEMSNFSFANNGRENAVLGQVKTDLTNLMKAKIPGYGDVLSKYGSQTQAAKDLASELSIKSGNAKPSTQLNQVLKLFKKDPKVLDNLTQIMGKEQANKFLNDVSGAVLSSWVPNNKLGNILRATGAAGETAAGITAGASIPHVTAGLAATSAAFSPKIVGKGATIFGKAAQKGVTTGARRFTTIAASKAK